MTSIVKGARDFEELARFLAELNTQKMHHIGYCGDKVEEIYETLKDDFILEEGQIPFLVARDRYGEIEAAIGLDIDGDCAEVWGPYNKTSTFEVQTLLWETIVQENPSIDTFLFFLNKENLKQQEFMKTIHAQKTGEHLILEVSKQNFEVVQDLKSTRFVDSDFQAFKNVHEAAFPQTYYNANIIVNQLNDESILKVLKTDSGEMIGYVYYELDLEMEEASLHYFAIMPMVQNQGYGTILLKEVITEIFTFPQINEIKLCVNHTNDQANHVYFKVGFEEKDVLFSYRLNRKEMAK